MRLEDCEACTTCAECGRSCCLDQTARLRLCGEVTCHDHECPDCPVETP